MKIESHSPSYHFLKNEINQGKLRLLSTISPARTASTALEMVLGRNSEVDATITQPFTVDITGELPSMSFDEREEKVYGLIKNVYTDCQEKKKKEREREKKGEGEEEGVIVLFVKVMARNLGVGFVAEHFLSLVSKVIFLFREPVLIITSALKLLPFWMMEDSKRKFLLYKGYDPEKMAKESGFSSFEQLALTCKEAKPSPSTTSLPSSPFFSFLIPQFFKAFDDCEPNFYVLHSQLEHLLFLSDDLCQSFTENLTLDEYAQQRGKGSWEELIGGLRKWVEEGEGERFRGVKRGRKGEEGGELDEEIVRQFVEEVGGELFEGCRQCSGQGFLNCTRLLKRVMGEVKKEREEEGGKEGGRFGGRLGEKVRIVDSTLIRLDPRGMFEKICGHFVLPVEEAMWGAEKGKDNDGDSFHSAFPSLGNVWMTVSFSNGLTLPTQSLLPLSSLSPPFRTFYVESFGFLTYFLSLSSSLALRPQREEGIETIKRLLEMVIGKEEGEGGEREGGEREGGEEGKVIADYDPIFAYALLSTVWGRERGGEGEGREWVEGEMKKIREKFGEKVGEGYFEAWEKARERGCKFVDFV